ncbi:MAG: serine hydrolase [Bacteroidota bacterium]
MRKISLLFCLSYLVNHSIVAQLDVSSLPASPVPLLQKLDSTIKTGKYERITSVLIAKDGKLLFEKYYQKANEDTRHNTRSVTKSMATLLTGIAIKQGHIESEKDKIFSYLQHKLPVQNPDQRKENIILEDLLTMSSCLECDDDNYFSRGNEERMYPIEDWSSFYLDLPIRSYPFGPKPADQPYGRAFSYCTAGAALMAEIVQSAVGMKLDEFAKQHLFQPLGIKDYTLHYNPEGTLNTAGGSEYRSRDFLKLIQLCLNQGKWNGKEIIPSNWLEKATTPKAQVREGVEYGYLFWLKAFGQEKKIQAFYMSGNGGHKMVALPELNVCVVITTLNYNRRNAHNFTDEIMNEFIVPAMME